MLISSIYPYTTLPSHGVLSLYAHRQRFHITYHQQLKEALTTIDLHPFFSTTSATPLSPCPIRHTMENLLHHFCITHFSRAESCVSDFFLPCTLPLPFLCLFFLLLSQLLLLQIYVHSIGVSSRALLACASAQERWIFFFSFSCFYCKDGLNEVCGKVHSSFELLISLGGLKLCE